MSLHGICCFTVFPLLSKSSGTNLRRRSDAVLDQPLVDKIHAPSATGVAVAKVNRHRILLGNTHSTQMYSFGDVNAGPPNCWLLLVSEYLEPLPASHCQKTVVESMPGIRLVSRRIWIDNRLARCVADPSGPTGNHGVLTSPFAD